jgi:hypothetical protein
VFVQPDSPALPARPVKRASLDPTAPVSHTFSFVLDSLLISLPYFSECPSDCDKCDEGPSGTGACLTTPLPSNAPSKCNCLNGSCDSSATCTCITGWANASNGTACATCDTGFFLDPRSGSCLSCGSGCNACSPSACTTCSPGTVQSTTDPTVCTQPGPTLCGIGSFQSGSACTPCNSRCASCAGPSSSDCTSCPSGSFLRAGQCLTFDSTGTCQGTSLVANKRRIMCDTCPLKCAQCSIPNFNPGSATQEQLQCDQCLPGLVLDNGNCVGTCAAGKVISSDGKICAGELLNSHGFPRTLMSIHSLLRLGTK